MSGAPDAIERVEDRLGLSGQPRAIVFHEKDGTRHAHAMWSRIDPETMTARRMDYSREKMQGVARELYREHGWRMPEGFADRSRSDPRNYTLEQWQQAKRAGKDAAQVKEAFQDASAISDSRAGFEHALKERGYYLARGDRRGFTAIDVTGEVYSVSRQTGIRTKQLQERLGDPAELQSLDDAREAMAEVMNRNLGRLCNEEASAARALKDRYEREKVRIVAEQREARAKLAQRQQDRHLSEQAERQERFRRGVRGLWDRITGQHGRIAERNRMEALVAQERDRIERDATILKQFEQRRAQREHVQKLHQGIQRRAQELREDGEPPLWGWVAAATLASWRTAGVQAE